MKWLLTIVAAMYAIGPALAREQYVYGPAPDWARFTQAGEAAVRAALPDPGNWLIEWPNDYMQAGWSRPNNVQGYLSCGVLRAITPVEGQDAVRSFAVVIDHDEVKNVEIAARGRNSRVNVLCDVLVSKGRMPPARFMKSPQDLAVAALGITIRAMPEGAYIVTAPATAPGPVARPNGSGASLKPGMVIARANGIALAGMGPAMASLLNSNATTLTLEAVTGERIDARRVP